MSETLPGVKVADFYTGVTAATMSKGPRPVKGKNQRSLKIYTLVEFLMILRHRRRYARRRCGIPTCIKAFNRLGFVTKTAITSNLQAFAFRMSWPENCVAKSNTPPGGKRGGVRQIQSFTCETA